MFSSFVCQFIIVKWMTRLECQCQLSVCCVAVLTGKQLLETALWTPSLPPSPPHWRWTQEDDLPWSMTPALLPHSTPRHRVIWYTSIHTQHWQSYLTRRGFLAAPTSSDTTSSETLIPNGDYNVSYITRRDYQMPHQMSTISINKQYFLLNIIYTS